MNEEQGMLILATGVLLVLGVLLWAACNQFDPVILWRWVP